MRSILVIEPDIAVGRLFETALRGAGYTVYLASSAPEGLGFLRSMPIEMVITHLNMPRGTGLDMVSIVQHEFPATKLLGISTEATEFDPAQAAPLLESVELLRNPIGVTHLLGTVQRVLGAPSSGDRHPHL
jgi:DNA-binding NtrC family response regulator